MTSQAAASLEPDAEEELEVAISLLLVTDFAPIVEASAATFVFE